MNFKSFAIVFGFLGIQSLASAYETAVILADVSVTFVSTGKVTTLKRAEVVRVLARNSEYSTASRKDNPPDWETSSEEEIKRAKQPMTIPSSSLVSLDSFQKVSSWDVKKRSSYVACDASCDYGYSYKFRRDGSFAVEIGSSQSRKKSVGQLYLYRGIYWAKIANEPSVDRYKVFYLQEEKLICDMIACSQFP